MLGEPGKSIVPHPRSARYERVRKANSYQLWVNQGKFDEAINPLGFRRARNPGRLTVYCDGFGALKGKIGETTVGKGQGTGRTAAINTTASWWPAGPCPHSCAAESGGRGFEWRWIRDPSQRKKQKL